MLPDFNIETAGLYAYLYSWMQKDTEHSLYRCVWLTHEEMQIQAGIGRGKFDRNIRVLQTYGLVDRFQARNVANKAIYQVREPLTEDAFRKTYDSEVAEFERKMQAIQRRIELDRTAFQQKKATWKVEQVALAQKPKTLDVDEIDL